MSPAPSDNQGSPTLGESMQPARASAIAAVVFASVGLLGAAAALTYAHQDTTQGRTTAAAHKDKQQDKHQDKAEHDGKRNGEKGNGDDAPGAGRAHAEAMKAWATCVAAAASGPKAENAPVPPKAACGAKPAPPGRAKHDRDGSPGNNGHATKPKAHGHSGSHQG